MSARRGKREGDYSEETSNCCPLGERQHMVDPDPATVTQIAVTEEMEPLPRQGNSLVTYAVDDVPSWPLCILLGFQHYLTAFGSTISVPLILSGPLCMEGDDVGLGQLMGTILVVSGISTILQSTFGIRLPIIQGATFAFLAPTFSILSLPKWQCPERALVPDNVTNETSTVFLVIENGTERHVEMGSAEHSLLWQTRLREVQGAIIMASLSQILLGFSGLLSVLMKFIGPLVVAPTVTLVGLALFDAAADKASQLWWIALLTLGLIILFSQCLQKVRIPWPRFHFSRKSGCKVSTMRLPVFELFPVLLAMVVSWLLCLVLTVSGALPSHPDHWGYNARTDAKTAGLTKAPWFRVPYPGQWGTPTISVSAVLGMVAGVLASMIESVGDYYACARLSGAPPPPPHALNRGIGMEGLCCVMAGAFGSGNGTTSYSENVAAIGITKVASRRVVQTAGLLLVVLGCLGKVGALFVTIPDPVVGGMFFAMFGMITAVGLSNIRYVDMRSPRNMCVLGVSLFAGLAIPRWVTANKEAINTGSLIADQIIEVLLSTSMFVGGFMGFVLDNLLPGTEEERGIKQWREESLPGQGEKGKDDGGSNNMDNTTTNDPYDIPFITNFLRRFPAVSKLPFCPPLVALSKTQDGKAHQAGRKPKNNHGKAKDGKAKDGKAKDGKAKDGKTPIDEFYVHTDGNTYQGENICLTEAARPSTNTAATALVLQDGHGVCSPKTVVMGHDHFSSQFDSGRTRPHVGPGRSPAGRRVDGRSLNGKSDCV